MEKITWGGLYISNTLLRVQGLSGYLDGIVLPPSDRKNKTIEDGASPFSNGKTKTIKEGATLVEKTKAIWAQNNSKVVTWIPILLNHQFRCLCNPSPKYAPPPPSPIFSLIYYSRLHAPNDVFFPVRERERALNCQDMYNS